jgi:WD40 repeat protein
MYDCYEVYECFFQTKKPHPLIVSPCGKFLGIKEKRTLHIWKVPKVDSNSAVSKTFSVLAFHPTERIVAAGDVTGRILIFRGFGAKNFQENDALLNRTSMTDEECKPGVRQNDDAESCSTWHWHSDAVNLLSFSSDGVYLYSGKPYASNYYKKQLNWTMIVRGARTRLFCNYSSVWFENFSNYLVRILTSCVTCIRGGSYATIFAPIRISLIIYLVDVFIVSNNHSNCFE